MSPQSDQLTPEDLKALSDVHDHLVQMGDPRATKVKAYLGTQNTADIDPSVLAEREHYRNTFHQEPPVGYPHHLPGTGLDELSGMSLGTGLATAPVATGVGMLTSGLTQKAAEFLGASPAVSTGLGMGAGLLSGSGLAGVRALNRVSNAEGTLPSLPGLTRFGLKMIPGGRAGLRAYDALSDIVNKSPSTPVRPPPVDWGGAARFKTEPIKPVTPLPIQPGRDFSPAIPPPGIPPSISYAGRFNAPESPTPIIPPISYPGRFAEPPNVIITPKIPPIAPGRSFQPPATEPVAPPPLVPGRSFQPIAPEPVGPPPLRPGRDFTPPDTHIKLTAPPPIRPGRDFSPPLSPPGGTPETPTGALMPNLPSPPPLTWADANRQLHHTLQNMELPGSPLGTKAASGTVTNIAKDIFGKGGAPNLTPEEVQSITNFVVKNGRLPVKGDKL
jgi:hypothetical protein